MVETANFNSGPSAARNILVFSDGTGQAGGFRFDEERTNIYKLFRACRSGPDSEVNPKNQVAYYDPGLGSMADGSHIGARLLRWVHNEIAQATGFGITRNIIDCYAALIELWRPGDRIYLFGFSRGAYTVRCLAGAIALCGIPTYDVRAQKPIRLDHRSARKIAAYAVKHVYQFTYSRPRGKATPRQRFLLETRDQLAARFRFEFCSNDPNDVNKANVYPHFIGVFDTVAALGSIPATLAMMTAYLLMASLVALIGAGFTVFAASDPWAFSLAFLQIDFSLLVVAIVGVIAIYLFTHLKFDFAQPGVSLRRRVQTIHLNGLRMRFYDCELNPNVGYARHAMAIDERRADFQRVPWSSVKETKRDELGIQWFEQVWFAGAHADVGGGYPENETRLSDSALEWMLKSAHSVPGGLQHDPDVLKLWPDPAGMLHDEVKAGLGAITSLFGCTWQARDRELSDKAIIHRSVYRRFDLVSARGFDDNAPYRPDALSNHVDFKSFYEAGATFPATSENDGQMIAAEPRG